jgi:pimeloyl-ACP methyl ester carboxylesterase/DNA-binding winged helix-turn-helix (wHTH) protein
VKFEFDSYTVDTDLVELREDSRLIRVEPQVFDIIVFLIQNRDRVVTRAQLFETVWNGRIVSLSTLTTRINAARNAIGDNGTDQRLIKTIHRKGYRFVGGLGGSTPNGVAERMQFHQAAAGNVVQDHNEVSFCIAADNTRIAYSKSGSGLPVVRVGNWFNSLEHDWNSPVWGYMLKWLATGHELFRYDMRGVGLSDHTVGSMTFDAFVGDLETVANATGHKKFVLFGYSDGAAVSVAYAVRHPERVSKLVLFAGFAQGTKQRGVPAEDAWADATVSMLRPGVGLDNELLRYMFTSRFAPDCTSEQRRWLEELLRGFAKSDRAENVLGKLEVTHNLDIVNLLPEVSVPTLVLHCRNDPLHPFEQGRLLAAHIPGAHFVGLEGNNHAMLEQDPDWSKFQSEFLAFLGT